MAIGDILVTVADKKHFVDAMGISFAHIAIAAGVAVMFLLGDLLMGGAITGIGLLFQYVSGE